MRLISYVLRLLDFLEIYYFLPSGLSGLRSSSRPIGMTVVPF